jgi:hypothetical protein
MQNAFSLFAYPLLLLLSLPHKHLTTNKPQRDKEIYEFVISDHVEFLLFRSASLAKYGEMCRVEKCQGVVESCVTVLGDNSENEVLEVSTTFQYSTPNFFYFIIDEPKTETKRHVDDIIRNFPFSFCSRLSL